MVADAPKLALPTQGPLARAAAELASRELCALLDILLLLYQRQPLTVARWLEIAEAVHASPLGKRFFTEKGHSKRAECLVSISSARINAILISWR